MATEPSEDSSLEPPKSPLAYSPSNQPVTPPPFRNGRLSKLGTAASEGPASANTLSKGLPHRDNGDEGDDEEDDKDGQDDQDDDDEAQDDEPKLKYHRLTSNLASVYRNGDATSCFVAGADKMVYITCLAWLFSTP
jgi:hypothetical protein